MDDLPIKLFIYINIYTHKVFFPKKIIIKKLGNFWKFPSSVKLVYYD
jgi:hypothetical protein